MKKLIIVSNEAHACGKTTLALLIEQYLLRRQYRVSRVITHLEQELPSRAELLELEEPFKMQDLADLMHDRDALVVDCQTGARGALGQLLRDGRIEELLAEMDAELTVIIPVCDDAHVLQGAREVAEEFSGLAEFICVALPLGSDVPASFSGSATEKVLRYLGAHLVSLPMPDQDTMDGLTEKDLDLPLGMTQRGLLPRFLTHQLLSWEVICADLLRDCENCLHPVKAKDTEFEESAYGRLIVR